MLSQFELQYDDCKPRCRGTIIMNRCWKSSSGRSVEGRLAVLSVFGSQSRRTVITLRSQYDNISVCPWPTTDPGLLSDPQPNHAVLLPLALQLWVPNGHFHCAEVKTEWSMFHLLFYREKMICTCRSPFSIIVNNISSGCFRQLVFVIFSPNITKADWSRDFKLFGGSNLIHMSALIPYWRHIFLINKNTQSPLQPGAVGRICPHCFISIPKHSADLLDSNAKWTNSLYVFIYLFIFPAWSTIYPQRKGL